MKLLSFAVCLGATCLPVPALAMNWCALPQIAPQREADMERLTPLVESLTGCTKHASESAHNIRWVCADDPSTSDAYEAVHVSLIRDPGKGILLLVVADDLQNLDMLRHCGIKDLRDGPKFDAGNIAFRDRVSLGFSGPRLTLTGIGGQFSAIVSDTKIVGEDPNSKSLWEGMHGIKTEEYPSTGVRLAGVDPISSPVGTVVEAFKSRGSEVRDTVAGEEAFPKWVLSPPVGLAGVREVTITGFENHLYRAEYALTATSDYERFVALLDGEYGSSTRSSKEGCTYRWWDSGRVTIRGEHCPSKSDTVTFINGVARDQLQQIVAKMKEQDARGSSDEPVVDDDMF